jgi:hypothetical protein
VETKCSVRSKSLIKAELRWLMPVVLATQRQRSGRSWFKASLGKQFVRPYLKKPFTKRAGSVAQGAGPEFKPQYHQKKKKKA